MSTMPPPGSPYGQSYGPPPGPPPPNYLVQAILTTIFCCLPFGIVSIVFAAQVNGKYEAGDYAGAVDLSSKAKTWAWVAFGVGLGLIVLYFVLFAASIATFGV